LYNRGKREDNNNQFATMDKREYEEYNDVLKAAEEGNDTSVSEVLDYMINEMADVRDTKGALKFKSEEKYAALKCFIYLYTANYSYKKIGSQLRRRDYEKISKVIAVIQKQLAEYNKNYKTKIDKKLQSKVVGGKFSLFRGISKPDRDMNKGKKVFWRTFTSTSLDPLVAGKFGNYRYQISIDYSTSHPYMIVPEELSKFDESEIILFPYFYLECTEIDNFVNNCNYKCHQIAPEKVKEENNL
jgi:hypothetical protein